MIQATGGLGGFGALASLSGTTGGSDALPRNQDEGLKRVASEFEAIFIGELMRTMRDSSLNGGLLGNSRAYKMYQEMHDTAMAQGMATTGEIGIGKMIYQELKQGLKA
jgi:flagellar protein FlgJ